MRNIPTLSVSELNAYIKMMFDSQPILHGIAVRGEISNFTASRSGHYYFTLKDKNSKISAVVFYSKASMLKFLPENGMKVIVSGSISVYEADGRYQIYVDSIEPDGVGALYIAYEQLKEKLEKEGLFDISRKKAIPKIPSTIGVITSPDGAAVHDIINITGRRYPLAKIMIYPSAVQGADAPLGLVSGVKFFNETKAVDVIIIGRGGGSLEDLWAFNDERLARTIANSEIPVISAVGHETDFTICDFVADLRAPTPSAAAELAVPDCRELLATLRAFRANAIAGIAYKIDAYKKKLNDLKNSDVLKDPTSVFEEKKEYVSELSRSLNLAVLEVIKSYSLALKEKSAYLAGLNPLAVLDRGYAAVTDEEGSVISSVKSLSEGQKVNLALSDGDASVSVEKITFKKR